ncbi:hypothetical protein HK405_011994, partial [Cladochytrium tenue]
IDSLDSDCPCGRAHRRCHRGAAYGALTIPLETQRLTLKRSNPHMSAGSAIAPPSQAAGSKDDFSVASPALPAGDGLQPPTPFREARDGVSAADRCRSLAQARLAVVEAHAAATAATASTWCRHPRVPGRGAL